MGGPRTELAVSPDEPNWVYAVCGNDENGLRGFYRSTNSGETFQLIEAEVNILAGDCDGGTCYTNISGGLQINQPYRSCSSQLTDVV